MANANTPYIAKAASPLINPIATTVFQQAPNPLSIIAAAQTAQAAYVMSRGYAANNSAGTASGASNSQNLVSIIVRAAGRATGGTTTNFTPSIEFGRSTTAASNTVVGALTATAFNTASGNWYIAANLVWDPVSGQINGTIGGFAGSGGAMTLTATAAITPVTGQTLAFPATTVSGAYSDGELEMYFSAAGIFSATNAANIAYLDLFEVDFN